MEVEEFVKWCKEHISEDWEIPVDDIFVVWYNYTLGNCKAVFGIHGDYRYVECTYHQSRDVIYVDVYEKYSHSEHKVK